MAVGRREYYIYICQNLDWNGEAIFKKEMEREKKKEESSMSILGDWENDVVFRIKTR